MAGQVAAIRRPIEQPAIQAETIEIIDSTELAARLKLPKSWVQEACRSRATDVIPHLKFGKYRRFRWGSRELAAWLERRMTGSSKA